MHGYLLRTIVFISIVATDKGCVLLSFYPCVFTMKNSSLPLLSQINIHRYVCSGIMTSYYTHVEGGM